jgi:hypothetical protein
LIFFFLAESGNPSEKAPGRFWSLTLAAFPAENISQLHYRLEALKRSFLGSDYRPMANPLLPARLFEGRRLQQSRHRALLGGTQRIAGQLGVRFFLLVLDKSMTNRPAAPEWIYPMALSYLARPIDHYLVEERRHGTIVANGRHIPWLLQLTDGNTATSRRLTAVSSQPAETSYGLQVGALGAGLARRYYEHVYPRRVTGQELRPQEAAVLEHYQTFVKPHTWIAKEPDARGTTPRGFVYLWKSRPSAPPAPARDDTTAPA